ncbi:hypothetical protein EUGRSUZ_F00004 [Eucalyptus grandis]|uniref:Uncharacterized protein n=2 Tax=Eucalyptus grandis TaxID=71139 RepID=A0ACC3KC87_EUCGR|nr:hypothetical protein EUGRSUZ_F00004 [Eucalyptus grandis]
MHSHSIFFHHKVFCTRTCSSLKNFQTKFPRRINKLIKCKPPSKEGNIKGDRMNLIFMMLIELWYGEEQY